jgi:hypothetical protein
MKKLKIQIDTTTFPSEIKKFRVLFFPKNIRIKAVNSNQKLVQFV